ncbi:hypothetical protein [Oceanicaulis sp. MMSF_3324]|uniref:hypothetical protein n=1 Tax=Oceanicaulis sp. MMSF_3324 TaxID=3046702 RepID=UPI00273FE6A4|nr:hypothetical protein [Oceanicaulis sp. MMSF_3324]
MIRLNAASVFVSRRMRLLVMAAVVIGCLKLGLAPARMAPDQSPPVHAETVIVRESNAERAQGPDKPGL